MMTHQTLSVGEYWKLVPSTLNSVLSESRVAPKQTQALFSKNKLPV